MELTVDQRWDLVERISKETVEVGKYEPSLKDALADVTVRPATGIPFAIAVIYGFWAFFCEFAGTLFTDGFFCKIFDGYWLPWLQGVFAGAPAWVFNIFVGDPLADNCFEAFGVLSSGIFVAIGVVLPAIVAFYLIFAILEDVGYMPRLAVLVDTLLHKIGLHGYAIVPTILSLGCNVPGVTATRSLETRKQRFLAITLLGVFVPCGAQIGIMEGMIPGLIGWVFLALAIGYFGIGWIINKIVPGESPEILMDVPPYQMPTARNIWMKLWTRTSKFLTVAVPFVLLGCVIVAVLYITGAMDAIASGLSPVITGVFGLPQDTAAAMIAGFLRKDLAVGTIGMLAAGGMTITVFQVFTAVVLLSIYFPCLATFALMIKELNWKEILGTLATLIVMVFVYGAILHLIGLSGIGSSPWVPLE
ncbi:MAG: nucleoside recognition domain-containing protein [Chloroflexota bacterium]|nr:nucleoside recognition domain-containing protein [Chloroflexota bacterium]